MLELKTQLKLPDDPLVTINTKPHHMANAIANICSVAVAGYETCLDFYHASAFAMRKAQSQTALDVEPVVRVDMRTSLFVSFVVSVNDIATQIQLKNGENHERI